MLGRCIATRPRPPATVRDLEIALLKEWDSIPQSLIDNLIASLTNSANRSYRIVTGGTVRDAKHLPRKSHTCSMGLRSEIVPANPYVQYPHSLRAVRQLLCNDMVYYRP
ncbi:hypothetical protein TNCV_2585461 [Trichonephila clavipes]|nr:hypothetical protein TNCV_2585461 [Trichonephila clavipes]